MTVQEFEKYYKDKRKKFFNPSLSYVYSAFESLRVSDSGELFYPTDVNGSNLTGKSLDTMIKEGYKDFFIQNASRIIDKIREKSFESFLERESEFNKEVFEVLIGDNIKPEDNAANASPKDLALDFLTTQIEHVYSLNLSNTQARRSRAGGEFEAILNLLLIACGFSSEEQCVIEVNGTKIKIDFALPGKVEFKEDKSNCILLSLKTTLRERGKQVPDEKNTTTADKVYLCTLDDKLTPNTIKQMSQQNVYIVTTKENKSKKYADLSSVKTFEEIFEDINIQAEKKWPNLRKKISNDRRKEKKLYLKRKIAKYKAYPLARNFYKEELERWEKIDVPEEG